MATLAHPSLRFRARPVPGLRRPTQNHRILGSVVFNNREPCWQISNLMFNENREIKYLLLYGRPIARISESELDTAANWLETFRSRETALRSEVAGLLDQGRYRSLDLAETLMDCPETCVMASKMRLASLQTDPRFDGDAIIRAR